MYIRQFISTPPYAFSSCAPSRTMPPVTRASTRGGDVPSAPAPAQNAPPKSDSAPTRAVARHKASAPAAAQWAPKKAKTAAASRHEDLAGLMAAVEKLASGGH